MFPNSSRDLIEGYRAPTQASEQCSAGWVKKSLMRIQVQEEDVVEDGSSAPGTSCVHGSVEVLESVLLLLLANLISSVLLISVIISGQLMAAQGAGICLA